MANRRAGPRTQMFRLRGAYPSMPPYFPLKAALFTGSEEPTSLRGLNLPKNQNGERDLGLDLDRDYLIAVC